MAIFHLSVKTVSRSSGRSAVAAAAYRSGEKLTDYTTGEIKDYTNKGGVLDKGIVLPIQNLNISRQDLWNMAERSEKRKNSTVAREIEVALPAELSADEQKKLVQLFCHSLTQRHQVAVDYAIHAPSRQGDDRNYHAHILMTTRRLTADGELGEKTREWDDKKQGAETVKYWRESWAHFSNMLLEKYGEKIDNRTLEEQGVDREPTKHKGVARTAMERKGVEFPTEPIGEPIFEPHFEKERAEIQEAEREIAELEAKLIQVQKEQEEQNPERMQAEKDLKNDLNQALQHRMLDIRLMAICHPHMKPEWLQKVVEKHSDKMTVQAAENAIENNIYNPNKPVPVLPELIIELPKMERLKEKISVLNKEIRELEKSINQIEEIKKEQAESREKYGIVNHKIKTIEAEQTVLNTLKRKIGIGKSTAEPLEPLKVEREWHYEKYHACEKVLKNEKTMSEHRHRQLSLKNKTVELKDYQEKYDRLLSKMNEPEHRLALQVYLNFAAERGNYKTNFISYLEKLEIKIDSNQAWSIYQDYRRNQPDYKPTTQSKDKGHGMSR